MVELVRGIRVKSKKTPCGTCFIGANCFTFVPLPKKGGVVAQLVEQRTENPCVGGSIPSHTTTQKKPLFPGAFCMLHFSRDFYSPFTTFP